MLEKVVTLLFLSGDVVPLKKLAEFLGISKEEIIENAPYLSSKLEEIGLTLLIANDGVSIVTKSEHAALVEQWTKEDLKGELTPAALQVLTLVAYLGFPTRDQISYIRGVQSNQSIRILAVRGLINRIGEVCSLTTESLKQLGITKVEDLPEYEKLHAELKAKLQEREQ
jgi:segregation and condensation protein B